MKDPFIRGIVGLVVVAAAASFAISTLGSGTKAIITLALSLSFGVILVILRAIMNNIDNNFVRMICFASAGVIMSVFLIFAVFLIPAAFICWPSGYAQILGLTNCAIAISSPSSTRFTPTPYAGPGILPSPDNGKYTVLVFYVPGRQGDAERIVGAMLQAGYKSDGGESDLNEVIVPDRRPGTIVIRTTSFARPIVDEVSRVVRLVLPIQASHMSALPEDFLLQRAHLQVLLF